MAKNLLETMLKIVVVGFLDFSNRDEREHLCRRKMESSEDAFIADLISKHSPTTVHKLRDRMYILCKEGERFNRWMNDY